MNGELSGANLGNWRDPGYNRASLIEPAPILPNFSGASSPSVYALSPGPADLRNVPFLPAAPQFESLADQNDRDGGHGGEPAPDAKEKNKAAQRAYRQRTKVRSLPGSLEWRPVLEYSLLLVSKSVLAIQPILFRPSFRRPVQVLETFSCCVCFT
jgi:hypothetical protein